MEQKKSTLKEIKATVMPQTAEGLQMLMEETGLTVGEVIDRLTLQMCPDDLGFAVCFAQDQVFFQYFKLAGGRTGRSPDENHYIFGRACASRSSKGLRASSHFQACREIKGI